ncbi:MAG: tubulin-like doman-containing protein [Ktedonobacteraceae bacterium]
MASILTPTLVISLGSTPALVELELCRHMLSLDQDDYHRVAFVHIDTAEEPSELIAFHRKHQGLFRRFRQDISVPVDIDYAPLPKEVWHTYIPSRKPQYYATGAAGIRNNGHVAAAFDWRKVDQAIESALQAIEKLETTNNQRTVKEVHVNIVAFLGGGTGSGILGDISILVRQKLITRQYMQRINLFCILPDWMQGSNSNDIDRRKSNATACLLELIALSLVADSQPGSVYHKYMLDEGQNPTSGAIANEIYLIGRTAMGNIEDTARIVGLDLFQRITDSSGVGHLEHSEWMNRLTLESRDDRKLPTMFGTSCPLEVRFPLEEVATAYAQISASYLLPLLFDVAPTHSVNTADIRQQWEDKWGDVATLELGVQGKPLAVDPSQEFTYSEFLDASPDTLDSYWAELERRRDETAGKIKTVIQKQFADEKRRIDTLPNPRPNELISPVRRKINHLRSLQEEYEMVLYELRRSPAESPPKKPEWSPSWLYRIPYFGKRFRQMKAERIRKVYNEILEIHAYQTRYTYLLDAVEDLSKQVKEKLEYTERRLSTYSMDLQQKANQLANMGYGSAAWHGMLDRPHPHQRHIFDLRSLYKDPEEDNRRKRNLASERLCLLTAFGVNEHVFNQQIEEGGFIDRVIRERIKEFIPKCTAYLAASERDERFDPSTADTDLELQSGEHLVERVVNFFYDYFLRQLREKNLIELLRVGAGTGQAASVSQYLYEHLDHIKGLARSLIGFQQTLWPEGTRQLFTNVYLGMNWKDGREQEELREAVNKVGAISDRNQTPRIEKMEDPHRLQVSYGQHGISLSTVQEFYRETNSAMAEYIRYQREWYGSAKPHIFPDPLPNTYGSNNIPIHNCGEMERLVCDPVALKFSENLPHAARYGTSLIGRVIRDTTRINNAPEWSAHISPGVTPDTSSNGAGSSVTTQTQTGNLGTN